MPFPSSEVVRLKDVLPVGAYPDHTSRRWWPPAEAQYRDWLTLMQAVVFIRADTAAVSFARNTKPDRKHLSHGPPGSPY
jgi:hypothetical protein